MAWTLDTVLAELLGRMRALKGHAVQVGAEDLRGWPPAVVLALQASGVLVPSKPVNSAVCDGCEQACVMPVQVQTDAGRAARAFILCDKRDDIDSVPVEMADLAQWRMTAQAWAEALAGLLADGKAVAHGGATDAAQSYRIGFVQGRKERAALHLHAGDEGLHLALVGHAVPLQDALMMRDGKLALDHRLLARRADAPADVAAIGTGEPKADMGRRLLKRKLELKAAGQRNFLKVIAREEGCSDSWVKQLIAEASVPNPFAGLASLPSKVTTALTPKKRAR